MVSITTELNQIIEALRVLSDKAVVAEGELNDPEASEEYKLLMKERFVAKLEQAILGIRQLQGTLG